MASYCYVDADEGRGLPLVPKRTMGSVTSGTRPREDSRLMEKMTRARPVQQCPALVFSVAVPFHRWCFTVFGVGN